MLRSGFIVPFHARLPRASGVFFSLLTQLRLYLGRSRGPLGVVTELKMLSIKQREMAQWTI